ncbi:unnamed protein product [Caenorhabditis brenneri]
MSILDIPDLPMIKILENCNFMSLICLRKTCHNLRNFIDYLAPETEVTCIEIKVLSNIIMMHLSDFSNCSPIMDVSYKKCSHGCELEYSNNSQEVIKCIKDADFTDVFCMDLAVILRMQKMKLDRLQVSIKNTPKKEPKKIYKSTGLLSFLGCCSRSRSEPRDITEDLDSDKDLLSMCNQVYDTVEKTLQSRPLRVERMELYATGERQLLQILPYTDSNVLNSLSIRCFPNQLDFYDDIDMEIDDLVKLKQWRMLKKLWIYGFTLKGSIEDFVHFEHVHVTFEVVTANDFLFVKEKFLTTPNLSKFCLYFDALQDPENFNETVGHPIYPNIDKWEFPINETNQYLSIDKRRNSFVFERKAFSSK